MFGKPTIQAGLRSLQHVPEEEAFGYTLNWVAHKMTYEESVTIRIRIYNDGYQDTFSYHGRNLRVSQPVKITENRDFIFHDRQEADCGSNLTSNAIKNSITTADTKNLLLEISMKSEIEEETSILSPETLKGLLP